MLQYKTTHFDHLTAPFNRSISPRSALSSELFPLPVVPIIIVSLAENRKIKIFIVKIYQ